MMRIALTRKAETGTATKIVDLGELSYDEMGDLKRMVDSEVIRRVMAKVESNYDRSGKRDHRSGRPGGLITGVNKSILTLES